MAFACIFPLEKTVLKDSRPAVKQEKQHTLEQQLVQIVESVRGPGPKGTPQQTVLEILGVEGVNHPKFMQVRELIAEHLGRGYAFLPERPLKQCCARKGEPATVADLGDQQGEQGCGIECIGYNRGFFLLGTIAFMAKEVVYSGFCTDPPIYREGYANQLVKERMMSEEWKWFNVETLSEDAIIFAFQLLYKHHTVFLRQHWLGVVAMQNPMDAWSINDIIYTLKPDLIIEAGTANGGSALMWASMLHLIGKGGRVVTLDMNRPEQISWVETRENPWDNPLWDQYVTFIQGSSTDPAIHKQVKDMADKAKMVLVLLDSSHEEDHVGLETGLYCPLASPGSYCIVQDTKMGRFNWHNPKNALQAFLASHPEFASDRTRELLFTDHPSGYLKRTG